MSDAPHGQLMISKGGEAWTASLSSDLAWSCDNESLERYLRQIFVLYSRSVIRATMQATKRDLEWGGYAVELHQTRDSVISDIITVNRSIRESWSNVHGWAPTEAAELLSKSRLDRQVSLSCCLTLWLELSTDEDHDGRLILAWANLGSLVEGTLKFFLSVYESDYSQSPCVRGYLKKPCDIDELGLDELRQFFSQHVWTGAQVRWDGWLIDIQRRRNAIHAYKDRDIGTFDGLFAQMGGYLDLLMELEGQTPAPDS